MDQKDREIYAHVIDAIVANTHAINKLIPVIELLQGSVTHLLSLYIKERDHEQQPAE